MRKQKLFGDHQAATACKDVECAFGVLQSRFSIIRKPSLAWDEAILSNIMVACIITHNMIVEDERDILIQRSSVMNGHEWKLANTITSVYEEEPFEYYNEHPFELNTYLAIRAAIPNRSTHVSLKSNLVEHIWQLYEQKNQE